MQLNKRFFQAGRSSECAGASASAEIGKENIKPSEIIDFFIKKCIIMVKVADEMRLYSRDAPGRRGRDKPGRTRAALRDIL